MMIVVIHREMIIVIEAMIMTMAHTVEGRRMTIDVTSMPPVVPPGIITIIIMVLMMIIEVQVLVVRKIMSLVVVVVVLMIMQGGAMIMRDRVVMPARIQGPDPLPLPVTNFLNFLSSPQTD